ncbi:MAG: ribosomal RNA small subunit methyltransferase A [Gaiellaceae bacterium]
MAVRRRSSRGEATGQHFLRSKRLVADLVREAEVARGDLIVEIGGGGGVLTHALAQTGAILAVVERDPALAARLRASFAEHPTVAVLEGDIAAYEWPDEPFAVVANLPFAGSGAILARLLRDPQLPLRSANVIVQWEFAAKHAAVWPATMRSIHWRAWYDVSIARRLARTAFSPPPTVDTGVLQLRRRAQPRVAPELHEAYWDFLTAAFDAREPIRRGSDQRSRHCRSNGLPPLSGSHPKLPRGTSTPDNGRIAFAQGSRA